MSQHLVAALYHFTPWPDFAARRDEIINVCHGANIKGILLLAGEGLNGTIAGPETGVRQVLEFIRSIKGFEAVNVKESWAETSPFSRMKVRLKKEIVTLRRPEADPTQTVGTYVEPQQWNAVIADPDTILVDTRNHYEVQLGTFEGAMDPKTDNFVDFPTFVEKHLDPAQHKRVAMFCTGGIRCEKASSYMLEHGFDEVLHLKGGILNYLKSVPESDSKWNGECFVFDQRVSLDHQLRPGNFRLCYGCRQPLSVEDRERSEFEEGISCHYCAASVTEEQRAARKERMHQIELADSRGIPHIAQSPKDVAAQRAEKRRLKEIDRARDA